MNIPCPWCGETLFRLHTLDDKGTFGMHKDDPARQLDKDGNFVTCPGCQKRVALEPTRSISARPGFRVAPHRGQDHAGRFASSQFLTGRIRKLNNED